MAPLQVTPAMPDSASEVAPVILATGRLITVPLSGVARAMVGGVLSMLTVKLALAVFPAASVAVPLTV